MKIEMTPIGYVHVDTDDVPRHWTVSDLEGRLVLDATYIPGMKDIHPGNRIVVLFNFHKSPLFNSQMLVQEPRHHKRDKGVFSICSPKRPNPIGLSVLEVLSVQGQEILVKGIDMLDGTPILDIKPHMTGETQ